jgi:NAD(P) transhydrogenase
LGHFFESDRQLTIPVFCPREGYSAEKDESSMKHYDLIVIGGGPAGEKGAAQAAYFGKKVALIEESTQLGGACINTGTLPSKTLRESALYFSGLRQRGLYGIDYSLREGLTVHDFMHHKDEVVESERNMVRKNIAGHSIDLFIGKGQFESTKGVVVHSNQKEPEHLSADVFLVATGSRPHRPPEIPFDDKSVFDSDSILQMGRIPQSMAVVGGGVIGVEYASIFAALGVKVTLLDSRDRLLPFLDKELSELLRNRLEELGVKFYLNDRSTRFDRTPDGIRIDLQSGARIETETALFAAGRRATIEGLGLENAGLTVNKRGYFEVNEFYQTSVSNIYAAGDVIGFPALASTSMEQGRIAVCHAFGFEYKKRLARMLPMGIYSIPEISSVGESEESCTEKKIPYAVGRGHYANNARAQITGDQHGLLKLVFRRDDRKLLGLHIIGESATELIHLGMLVLEIGGAVDLFIELVFNYPTLSEIYKYAAYDGLGNLSGHKLREG